MSNTNDRAMRACDYFSSGYNCAQAVFLAYADLYGIDEDTAVRLTYGLGGGFGRVREVCGAVSAAVLLIGLERGTADVRDKAAQAALYQDVREYLARFTAEEESIICRTLLGLDEDLEDLQALDQAVAALKEKPCPQLVEKAARLFEAMRDESA